MILINHFIVFPDTYTGQSESPESMYNTYAKKLPELPQQQKSTTYPSSTADQVQTTSASAALARNFFQSQNNTVFRSTIDQYLPDDNEDSTDMQQVWMNAGMMTDSNHHNAIDTSYSSANDLDEKDYIANGDIRLRMTYYGDDDNDDIKETTATSEPINHHHHQLHLEDATNTHTSYKTDNHHASASLLLASETANPIMNNNNLMINDLATTTAASSSYDYGKSESSHTYSKPNLKNMDSFPSEDWNSGPVGSYDENQTTYNSGGYYNGSTHTMQENEYEYHQDPNMMGGYDIQGMSQGTDSGQTKAYEDGIMGTSLEGIEELDEYEKDDEYQEDDQYNDEDDYYMETEEKDKLEIGNNQDYYGKALGKNGGYKDEAKEFYDIIEEETIEVDENEDEELNELIKEPITTVSSPALTVPTTIVVTTASSISPSQNGGIALSASALVMQAKSSITATLATSISNTITTTITGSPSIIIEQSGEANSNDNNNNSFSFSDKGNNNNLSDAASKQPAKSGGATAKQKWHWAYNKIVMQLNVSGPSYF